MHEEPRTTVLDTCGPPRRLQHVGSDHQVVVEELALGGAIRLDPTDLGRGEKRRRRAWLRRRTLGLCLPAKIDLVGRRRHDLADRLPLQPAHQRRAHQAAVSRHPDPLAGQVKQWCSPRRRRRELERPRRPRPTFARSASTMRRHQARETRRWASSPVRSGPSTRRPPATPRRSGGSSAGRPRRTAPTPSPTCAKASWQNSFTVCPSPVPTT